MIRCVRMSTGEDGDSLFEEGSSELPGDVRGGSVGQPVPVVELSFQETGTGGSHEWQQDPVPRLVITLSGTLEFETKSGATFTIRPGDVLLAQDNTGSGHKWKLIGEARGAGPTSSTKAASSFSFTPAIKEQQS